MEILCLKEELSLQMHGQLTLMLCMGMISSKLLQHFQFSRPKVYRPTAKQPSSEKYFCPSF